MNKEGNIFNALVLGLELGFLIAVPLAGSLVAGVLLDRLFGTSPIFLITFIIASLAGMFFEVRYLILPFLEKRSQDNKSTKN